jgi:hypothetical protein
MLSPEKNERLTRVGPGTPMGELLRRYWQPIAGVTSGGPPGFPFLAGQPREVVDDMRRVWAARGGLR